MTFPTSIKLLQDALFQQEAYFKQQQHTIEDLYKLLRETISSRNSTLLKLSEIENSIAILQEVGQNDK